MKTYEAENIRNIGVVGHGDSGKTSLVSAFLFDSGTVNRLGSVDEGTTITDFDDEEIARKISLQSALAFCEFDKKKINMIDTPGYANFIMEARASLRVLDAGLVVVCAVSGVEVQTEDVWGFLDEFTLPRIIVINKLDRERASFERTREDLAKTFGREAVAIQIPIGAEKDFAGVVDLVQMKAFVYEADGSGKFKMQEIPDSLQEQAQAERRKLTEMVAEMDDALLERYLEEEKLSQEDLLKGLAKGVRARKLFPIVCASATKNIGIHRVLSGVSDFLPSPLDMPPQKGINPKDKTETERKCAKDAPYSALVFKTIADPYAGKISLFRVYSGRIQSDSTVHNATKDCHERFGSISVLQGKTPTGVPECVAGDIASISKLKETTTGDTLAAKESPILYTHIEYPEPAITFAIEPKAKGDEDKISQSLQRLAEEDPTLRFGRDAQTRELLLSGTGETHVEVVVSKLKKKFGVDVNVKPPKIPYRETITKTVATMYRHKKQTGGAGQFAEVHLRVEPLPRGADFEYASEVFGGAISSSFIPSIEKGIRQVMESGVVAGYPVVDVKAVVFDGKEHPVDSKDIAFQIAGREVFKKAVLEANPILLEPIMNVEVYAPEEFMGDIMGDLNSRRGRVQGMKQKAKYQGVVAQVPMAEMLSYAPTLKSITGGRGYFHMELSHYEAVPAHIAEKIVAQTKKEKEKED
jgi:elongation factor G